MKRIGTYRRKTRAKFTKHFKKKGKISLTNYFQNFAPGERVMLSVEPAIHKGMYDPKFMGKAGIIKEKKGKCYEVKVQDQNKEKCLIVHPVHLKRL
ncbi:MAG: 50S ribosomal protein L21e [Nanoarchaeota archaeon]|nr:50S ribosomal protein L21e [Nanoarchaeota archaeon]